MAAGAAAGRIPAGPPPDRPGDERNGEAPAPGGVSSPGELIATVSHELRQPLASIRGFTEMLLGHWDDFTDGDKVDILGAVHHDALRLSRLVDELLDVSRLESGRMPLFRRETDIAPLVHRVLADLKLVYPELQATVEIPARFPPLAADPFKLEQVLANILENACKYGSPGTVRISLAERSGPGRGTAEIAVSDQGAGIDPEELPHITEKFFHRGAESEVGGLGLGLWISRGIVEAHGGALVATSGRGQGTTVRFTIPLHQGRSAGKLAGP
ncbi:MAG: sensor histidine kinase [Acidimicrobiales bacterium]